MKNGWYFPETWKAYEQFKKEDEVSEKITDITSLAQVKQPRRYWKMIQYSYTQVGRVLTMIINSIIKEIKPALRCVNTRFKYEKLSNSVDQFTFIVNVHSDLKNK